MNLKNNALDPNQVSSARGYISPRNYLVGL
jgi:hypothetical protein